MLPGLRHWVGQAACRLNQLVVPQQPQCWKNVEETQCMLRRFTRGPGM